MRVPAALLLLALAVPPVVAKDSADPDDAALVAKMCVDVVRSQPEMGTQEACFCALGALLEHYGKRDFGIAVLGELPEGVTREEAKAIADTVSDIVPHINTRCGTNI